MQIIETIFHTYYAFLHTCALPWVTIMILTLLTMCYAFAFSQKRREWGKKRREWGKKSFKLLPLPLMLVPFLLWTWHSVIIFLECFRLAEYWAVDTLTYSRACFLSLLTLPFSTLCRCAAGCYCMTTFQVYIWS